MIWARLYLLVVYYFLRLWRFLGQVLPLQSKWHTSKFYFWFTKNTFFQVQGKIYILNCLHCFQKCVFVLTSSFSSNCEIIVDKKNLKYVSKNWSPSLVWFKSPQAIFTNHHKQDFSLLTPTTFYKVKKKVFTLDQPATLNSTEPPHPISKAHSFLAACRTHLASPILELNQEHKRWDISQP